MEKVIFKVSGLDCAEEVAILKRVVGTAQGVQELEFNIIQAKMAVTYDPKHIDSSKLRSLISSTGMKAEIWGERQIEEKKHFWQRHGRLVFTLLSALFLISGTLSHYLNHPNLLDLLGAVSEEHRLSILTKIMYFLAIVCGVWFVLPKALFSLRRFRPDMNLLMVIAVIGAIIIQEWFEAGVVAFLFALALLLESWSVERARRAVSSLMELSPTKARVLDKETHELEEKNVEEVEVEDLILVRPGEKIPLDGIVEEGSSSVDQSPITGESIPITKEIGDEVFAGTLNEDGALVCRVTKPAEETTLAKIIKLVEDARLKRSESEQWVETFAHYYTPFMLILSLLVMIIPPLFFSASWFDWVYRGLVLLVIACPCALVISTPVSIVAGLTSAAKNGILIKGGVYLEEVGKLRAIALDKTGTLTYGHPEVQEIIPMNHHTRRELLERAVALERPSEHPLARAIVRKGKEEEIETESVKNFQIVKGKGAQAIYKDKLFWIGSHRFMHEMNQETEEIHKIALKLEDAGHSIIAIGTDEHVCGLISVADQPRKWINETISSMKGLGIKNISMLTGDNEPTAKAIADLAGIDAFFAELLPEEKVEKVISLKEKWGKVGMIGDGVNDAPAMAAASIGFAMGGMGTDAAIETADIAFMSDDLSKLPWLIRHSRRTLKLIKQNIISALGVKAVFITLAFLNLATLWMAIAADTGMTLLVIFNALRLLKI